jgi:hypothetical protein
MNLPYFVKLFVFCAAFFFIIHGLMAVIVHFAASSTIRLAERMPSRRGARVVLYVRFFSAAFSIVAVLALCAPSYLLFEPRHTIEHLNLLFVIEALVGLAIGGTPIFRTLRSLIRSTRLIREIETAGRAILLPEEPYPALEVSAGPPIFAMCGILHPRVVFSSDVRGALSAEQFDVALRHEQAHRSSRDNLKRVLLLLTPDVSPFSRCFADLENCWAKMSEWAADDDAILDDHSTAITLAEAVVRIARLGVRPRSPIFASLVSGTDLSARVDRLLMERLPAPKRSPQSLIEKTVLAVFGAASLIVTGTLALNLSPLILFAVHRVLEKIAR